jgi:hypothetical protein
MRDGMESEMEDARSSEQRVEERKAEMIAERQRKLEEILDAHDDFVRLFSIYYC